jgi:hypothetical protein
MSVPQIHRADFEYFLYLSQHDALMCLYRIVRVVTALSQCTYRTPPGTRQAGPPARQRWQPVQWN